MSLPSPLLPFLVLVAKECFPIARALLALLCIGVSRKSSVDSNTANLTLAQLVARYFYLAFLHPLARCPGPFLARYTGLYSAYHAWQGDIHLDMYQCHQRYGLIVSAASAHASRADRPFLGDYVRYAPNRLVFNTAQALQGVLAKISVEQWLTRIRYLWPRRKGCQISWIQVPRATSTKHIHLDGQVPACQ